MNQSLLTEHVSGGEDGNERPRRGGDDDGEPDWSGWGRILLIIVPFFSLYILGGYQWLNFEDDRFCQRMYEEHGDSLVHCEQHPFYPYYGIKFLYNLVSENL